MEVGAKYTFQNLGEGAVFFSSIFSISIPKIRHRSIQENAKK